MYILLRYWMDTDISIVWIVIRDVRYLWFIRRAKWFGWKIDRSTLRWARRWEVIYGINIVSPNHDRLCSRVLSWIFNVSEKSESLSLSGPGIHKESAGTVTELFSGMPIESQHPRIISSWKSLTPEPDHHIHQPIPSHSPNASTLTTNQDRNTSTLFRI